MNKRVLLVYANAMMETVLSVNVSSLSASLKKAGFDVKLFDTTFYRWAEQSATEKRIEYLQIRSSDDDDHKIDYKKTDIYSDFRQLVEEFDPLIIGVSVVEPTYELGLDLLKHISDIDIPTIMGGIHAIMAPELVINEDVVDMVCIGEGEEAFVELCNKLSGGKDHTDVPNMWIKRDGLIHKNSCSKLVDINTLPYLDFSIYEDARLLRPMTGRIYKTIIVEASRGCPYTCTYCADHSLAVLFKDQGRWYREKDIDRVIAEIKFYIDHYGAEYLYIMSESFLATTKARFDRFVELYADIKLPFWCQTRPENITAERLKQLKSINCHRISIGIEHGNEEFRREKLKRNVSTARIIEACKIIEDSGIGFSVNSMIGFPGETREMVFDTINVNRAVNADGCSIHIFTPYRGTKLREECIERGYIDPKLVAKDYFIESCMNMPQLTNEEIMGLYRTFPLYVKLPEEYFDKIRQAEKFDVIGDKAFEELRKVFLTKYI